MSFADVATEIKKTIEEAQEKAKEALIAELKDVFVRHPDLKVIKWTQYTPGFNDGDPCYFTIGDVTASNYMGVNAYGEWEGDDEHDEENEPADLLVFSLDYNVPQGFEDLAPLGKFINSGTGKDVLEFMFGDGVTVVVTADGVDTDEYDCGY
jgi:hypothetical protein